MRRLHALPAHTPMRPRQPSGGPAKITGANAGGHPGCQSERGGRPASLNSNVGRFCAPSVNYDSLCRLCGVILLSALTGCVSPQARARRDPGNAGYERFFAEEPNNPLARACRGDRAALHHYFSQARDPALDGARSEGLADLISIIRGYIGDRAFFAALSRESAEIQHAMKAYLYLQLRGTYPNERNG
jgi:hypothetical protein